MNVVVYEIDPSHPHPRVVPLYVRAEVAESMSLHEGDTVNPVVARDIRTACHYYTMGSTAQILNQLNDLQRGTTGSGKDDVGDAPSGLGDLPVAASHSRAA